MATTSYYSVDNEILGEDTSGTRRDYLTDALGSVTATVTSTAVIENAYWYKPYGEQLSKSGAGIDPRFLWNGKIGYRQTSCYGNELYIRARHYSYLFSIWNSQDPIGYADGFSYYRYVYGNPVNYIDITGKICCKNVGIKCDSECNAKVNWGKPWSADDCRISKQEIEDYDRPYPKGCVMDKHDLVGIRTICKGDQERVMGKPSTMVNPWWIQIATPQCCNTKKPCPGNTQSGCDGVVYGCFYGFNQPNFNCLPRVYQVCLKEHEYRHFQCCNSTCSANFNWPSALNLFLKCVDGLLRKCGISIPECKPQSISGRYCESKSV